MRTFTFGATKKRPMISHKPPIRVIFCCKSEKCQLGIFHFVGRKSSGQNVYLIYGCEIKLPIWKLDFWILASYQNGNLPLLKQSVSQKETSPQVPNLGTCGDDGILCCFFFFLCQCRFVLFPQQGFLTLALSLNLCRILAIAATEFDI